MGEVGTCLPIHEKPKTGRNSSILVVLFAGGHVQTKQLAYTVKNILQHFLVNMKQLGKQSPTPSPEGSFGEKIYHEGDKRHLIHLNLAVRINR